MLPSLKCQIFCFWSKFVSFNQLSRQNLALSLFSIYGKISSSKKLTKSTEQILRKMCQRPTDRHTDEKTNRTDFIEHVQQRWRFDHVLPQLENKTFLNYLA